RSRARPGARRRSGCESASVSRASIRVEHAGDPEACTGGSRSEFPVRLRAAPASLSRGSETRRFARLPVPVGRNAAVSRIPRDLEYVKTGFNAEAASAARFRAYAARATREGQPNLAKHWLDLAVEKDALAMLQLDAAEERRPNLTDIAAAIAEESYENDVL